MRVKSDICPDSTHLITHYSHTSHTHVHLLAPVDRSLRVMPDSVWTVSADHTPQSVSHVHLRPQCQSAQAELCCELPSTGLVPPLSPQLSATSQDR